MTDLERLLDGNPDSRSRALLEAARADEPPNDFERRLLSALGAGAALTSASAAAATTSAATAPAAAVGSASVPALIVAKWIAVGVLGGGLLAGGADALFSSNRTPVTPVRVAPGESVSAPPQAPVGARLPPAAATDHGPGVASADLATTAGELAVVDISSARPAVPVSDPGPAPSVEPSALGREVQAIDAARRAFAAGEMARALAELQDYQRITRTGVLDREARVLRIEIAYETGDLATARTLSEGYLREFPNDAHAARLRALAERRSSNGSTTPRADMNQGRQANQ